MGSSNRSAALIGAAALLIVAAVVLVLLLSGPPADMNHEAAQRENHAPASTRNATDDASSANDSDHHDSSRTDRTANDQTDTDADQQSSDSEPPHDAANEAADPPANTDEASQPTRTDLHGRVLLDAIPQLPVMRGELRFTLVSDSGNRGYRVVVSTDGTFYAGFVPPGQVQDPLLVIDDAEPIACAFTSTAVHEGEVNEIDVLVPSNATAFTVIDVGTVVDVEVVDPYGGLIPTATLRVSSRVDHRAWYREHGSDQEQGGGGTSGPCALDVTAHGDGTFTVRIPSSRASTFTLSADGIPTVSVKSEQLLSETNGNGAYTATRIGGGWRARITMSPFARGMIVDDLGQPYAEANVVMFDALGNREYVQADEFGEFMAQRVTTTGLVVQWAPRGEPAPEYRGQPTSYPRVDERLALDVEIVGDDWLLRIVHPRPGALTLLGQGLDDGVVATVLLDRNQRSRRGALPMMFSELLPGTYADVWLRVAGFAIVGPLEIVVRPGEHPEVPVAFTTGGATVRGRVVEDGAPSGEDIALRFVDPSGAIPTRMLPASITPDAGGSFAIANLPPITLELQRRDGETVAVLELYEGADIEVGSYDRATGELTR